MPISRFLTDITLSPEQHHVLEIALNHALRKIGIVDRDDPVCVQVARRMLAIHLRGVTDAVALAEITVREIRSH